jgi:hypothetical protein
VSDDGEAAALSGDGEALALPDAANVSAASGNAEGASTVAGGLLVAASNGAFSVTAGVESASPSCWARAAATDSNSKQTQKQAGLGFMVIMFE